MTATMTREEKIFLAALALSAGADRQRYLTQACKDDANLLNRVERLIEMHDCHDKILEQTSLDTLPIPLKDPISAGSKIGPYKLLQLIGTGGMGDVYMAQQNEPVFRKVAIKIIKHGMDSKNVMARFEAERHALAMMDHPNISRIYDAGVTESGRPYFVMELITGLSITKFCDRKKLGLRQRMELFKKVCNAVQHAHQKGVIHRDIKPGNILVTQLDGEAIPKVIDFGIAKAINEPLTEKTLFTSYGSMIGTPAYMSPEQAEMNGMDVDTCSDVYSLGVVLYELMTGTTPFYQHNDSGLRKFCDAICTEEPELASTRINRLTETSEEVSTNRNADGRILKQFLRGDVDWILAMSLAKQRKDRYATAAELAGDIQRHLNGEPVLAAAPSHTYRLKKLFLRHRLASISAAVLVACMLISTLVSFAFATRAVNAEKLAFHRLEETKQAQLHAETERDRALAAEHKLRELERNSRREAANAQALVRFIHQSNHGQSPAPWPPASNYPVTDIGDPTQLTPNEIGISPEGNMFVAGQDDTLSIEFLNCEEADSYSKNQIQLTAVGPENQKCAEQVLVMVTDELEKRFGAEDPFLIEPKMKLAEIFLEKEDWQAAEKNLRETCGILERNDDNERMKCKNVAMLAISLAKQNKKREALWLIEKNISAIRQNEEIQATFREAMDEIQCTVGKAGKKLVKQIKKVSDNLPGVPENIGTGVAFEYFETPYH